MWAISLPVTVANYLCSAVVSVVVAMTTQAVAVAAVSVSSVEC